MTNFELLCEVMKRGKKYRSVFEVFRFVSFFFLQACVNIFNQLPFMLPVNNKPMAKLCVTRCVKLLVVLTSDVTGRQIRSWSQEPLVKTALMISQSENFRRLRYHEEFIDMTYLQ